MKFLSFLCTKWMENCEAMTSSTHSFAYSYGLVKKCFLKICETSKCHNFLIFQPIFIRFSLLCLKFFTLSSEIELNLLWISSLSIRVTLRRMLARFCITTYKQKWLLSSMHFNVKLRCLFLAVPPSIMFFFRVFIIYIFLNKIMTSYSLREWFYVLTSWRLSSLTSALDDVITLGADCNIHRPIAFRRYAVCHWIPGIVWRMFSSTGSSGFLLLPE